MRLVCPFCGPRELPEFSFHKTVAEPDATAFEEVYERVNRMDYSAEHWQHVGGCRAWLLICRNPSTGEVLKITWAGSGTT
jgi:methylglutamate dehydrogenase subunit B